MTTSGSSTTLTTGPRARRPGRASSPPAARSCSGCSCWRPPSTTCSRSTTAGSSGSTPTWPAAPSSSRGTARLLFGGMGRLTENSVVNIKNKSHTVSARGRRPRRRRRRGDRCPGRHVRRLERCTLTDGAGRPTATTCFGLQRFKVYGDQPDPGREHQVRMEFAYDGGGLAKGGTVTLFVDGARTSARAASTGTQPMIFSADETSDVGADTASPSATTTAPRPAPSAGGCAGSRSTWASTTTTTSSRLRNASASP